MAMAMKGQTWSHREGSESVLLSAFGCAMETQHRAYRAGSKIRRCRIKNPTRSQGSKPARATFPACDRGESTVLDVQRQCVRALAGRADSNNNVDLRTVC